MALAEWGLDIDGLEHKDSLYLAHLTTSYTRRMNWFAEQIAMNTVAYLTKALGAQAQPQDPGPSSPKEGANNSPMTGLEFLQTVGQEITE